jgi:predicted DNA binding CopG/RHH family protein
MAITKKPSVLTPAPAALDRFIESAPDGTKTKATADDGVQITLRMSKEQLERITAVAKRQGIPRASYIKRAVFIQLEADEQT